MSEKIKNLVKQRMEKLTEINNREIKVSIIKDEIKTLKIEADNIDKLLEEELEQ